MTKEPDPRRKTLLERVGRLVFLAFCVLFTALAVVQGDPVSKLSYGGLAAVLWLLLILFVWSSIQKRRIGGVMREAGTSDASATQPEPPPSHKNLATGQGPLRFTSFREKELSPLPYPYNSVVTPSANIVGRPPLRILYLYNFYSFSAQCHEVQGLYRRFGPVYFLGSPATASEKHMFDVRLKENLAREVLVTPEQIDRFLENSSEKPFGPGVKNLGNQLSYLTGGYPQHSLLCSDQSWQHAVKRLFEKANVVAIDAAGYSPERGGLNWELGYVVNHVPTEKILLLTDEHTEEQALRERFSKAWREMESDSPNNRANAGAVRFVRVKSEEDLRTEIQAGSGDPPSDPANVLKQLSAYHCAALKAKYESLLFSERTFGLFLQES